MDGFYHMKYVCLILNTYLRRSVVVLVRIDQFRRTANIIEKSLCNDSLASDSNRPRP